MKALKPTSPFSQRYTPLSLLLLGMAYMSPVNAVSTIPLTTPIETTSELVVNSVTTDEQRVASVAMDSQSDFVVTWSSNGEDGSGWGVYAQRFSSDGSETGAKFQVNTTIAGDQQSSSIAMNPDGKFIISWQSFNQDSSRWGVYAQLYQNTSGPGLGYTGTEFPVNTATSGDQANPSVAMNAAGDFVISWESEQSGSGFGIYAQRYNADGTAAGGEIKVNTLRNGEETASSVAMDAQGNFVITWQYLITSSTSTDIYAQRFDANGDEAGDRFRVNDVMSGNQANPSITMNTAGDFVISWESAGQDGDGFGIFAKRYNADGTEAGSEIEVNTYTTGNQQSSSVAMDDSGDFIVSWQSLNQDSDAWGVYARHFNADGTPATDEFLVNSTISGSQYRPSVAMDIDGDFVMAWEGLGEGTDVYAQGYRALSAYAVGAEFRVNTYTTNSQGFGVVAMDADGDFVVSWLSIDQDGWGEGVYAQRYNADGSPVGTEFQVNTETLLVKGSPSVAMDADGDFVVSWSSSGQDGDSSGVYAQRFSADGSAVGTEFQVNTYTTTDQEYPSVAMDADGDFVVSWASEGQDGDGFGVYAQRFSADGSAVGTEFQVNTYTTSDQENSSVAMDADGDFVVSWESVNQDGSGEGVYAQRYNADGSPVGTEFQVNTYITSDQENPSVAMDADGDFVVSWQSFAQDGSFSGVYSRRYTADGMPVASEFRVNTQTFSNQANPNVAMDADGDFVVSWQSDGQDGDLFGVYAQRFSGAGETVDLNLVVTDNTDPVTVGNNFIYSLITTNNGTGIAMDVNLSEPLPSGITYVSDDSASAGWNCAPAATILECNLPFMAPGTNNTINVTVTASSAGTTTNTVTASAAQTDVNAADNTDIETTEIVVGDNTDTETTEIVVGDNGDVSGSDNGGGGSLGWLTGLLLLPFALRRRGFKYSVH